MDKRITTIIIKIIISLIIIISFFTISLSFLHLKSSRDCCMVDSDCAIYPGWVDEEPCCWDCGYLALTKKQYEDRRSWEVENCAGFNQSDCVRYKAPPENMFKAVCSAGVCRVVEKK